MPSLIDLELIKIRSTENTRRKILIKIFIKILKDKKTIIYTYLLFNRLEF